MISVYVEAPFATFRLFTAGYFRPTAGFMTPSATYGLLLNLAGIEMRHDDALSAMTLVRETGLPACRIALGTTEAPTVQSLYQQLHNYPVGTLEKEKKAERTRGSKYNIVPVRREILCGLKAYVLVDGPAEFESAVTDGIAGRLEKRYGLPFLGDNNFLPNRIETRPAPSATRWWSPIQDESDAGGLDENTTRLTITINRLDMSQSRSALFKLGQNPSEKPPDDAWVEVAY